MFKYYKNYTYPVPLRTRIFNIVRHLFMIPLLEKFLVSTLEQSSHRWWRKFIPPLYLYSSPSYRTVDRDGIQLKLDISKLLDHERYFLQDRYDFRIRNLFDHLKSHFHVLDIGANIGLISLAMAKICKDGCIYSFEPDSVNFERLKENVSLNKFSNLRLFNLALGDMQGSSKLYRIEPSNPGMNRILIETPEQPVPCEVVNVETLNSLYNQKTFTRVDFIKIDTEGFELKVLQGGRELIRKFRPVMFIEFADINLKAQGSSALLLMTYLQNEGYKLYEAKDMSPLDQEQLPYTDIICFPQQK